VNEGLMINSLFHRKAAGKNHLYDDIEPEKGDK